MSSAAGGVPSPPFSFEEGVVVAVVVVVEVVEALLLGGTAIVGVGGGMAVAAVVVVVVVVVVVRCLGLSSSINTIVVSTSGGPKAEESERSISRAFSASPPSFFKTASIRVEDTPKCLNKNRNNVFVIFS